MEKNIDPNFKELVLTICAFAPMVCLLATGNITKVHVWVALFTALFVYSIARVVVKRKTGQWKW